MDLYRHELLDHYRFPRHKGRLVSPDIVSGQHNPSCGDRVSFELKLGDGSIVEVAFDGVGCVISQATASMVAETIQGKSIEFVLQLTTVDIITLVGIDLGPTRLKCALLSLDALHAGLQQRTSKR